MKITFEMNINPKDYSISDTKEEHLLLAKELLLGRADMPDKIKIVVSDELCHTVGE